MHRDPRNFSQPERYWSERWLIANGLAQEYFVHNINACIPFSFGPANYVGKNLALQEMRVVICHVVQLLDIELAHGWDPAEFEAAFFDHFVAETEKLPVYVKGRQHEY